MATAKRLSQEDVRAMNNSQLLVAYQSNLAYMSPHAGISHEDSVVVNANVLVLTEELGRLLDIARPPK